VVDNRFLFEPEDCTILDHHPETCSCCGEKLSGEDANPYRHQVVDIPIVKPIVVEYRLHQLTCGNCGESTRATLPQGINPSGYETSVVALVAVLSGVYRHSQRMVQSAMSEVFGIPMSLGTVNKLRLEASSALSSVVESAKTYVQNSKVVGADETR
jgi:transposase